jgi:hypothetical protein
LKPAWCGSHFAGFSRNRTFGTIPLVWAPLGNSWYDSLQAKLTKRYAYGLNVQAAFTWSKSLANPAGTVNKSISAFDQPFIFNVGFNYDTPHWTQNRWIDLAASGWTLGGLLGYASGAPILAPTATTNMNSLLFQTTLMDRVAGQPLFLKDLNCHCIDPNKDFVLNPAAWQNPASGTWGNAAAYLQRFPLRARHSIN